MALQAPVPPIQKPKMGVEGSLIPTRFLLMLSHFTAVLMIFQTKVRLPCELLPPPAAVTMVRYLQSSNVRAALPASPTDTQLDERNEE